MSSLNLKRACCTKVNGSPSGSENSYWFTTSLIRWRRGKRSCWLGSTLKAAQRIGRGLVGGLTLRGMATEAATPELRTRTAWVRNLATPVRDYLNNETGGALVMAGAAVIALLWANLSISSYESYWTTKLSIAPADSSLSLDLRHFVNQGLMTFFFLVVGLEAKRELDRGELRERRRLVIPAFAAVGGMAVPALIYTAFNAGGSGAHGWGAAMSTDTAFVLGVLALLAPGGTRLRVTLLSAAVVDDLVALVVIATVYTDH